MPAKHIYNFFHRHYHTRYHGIYRHAKKLFVFDLALLGLAIVMLGAGLFFFFWKPGLVGFIDLSISLGEKRIKSGETACVSVSYSNRSKFKLKDVSLSLRLPDGFIVDRSLTPEDIFDSHANFVSLKEIPAGGKGQTKACGRLWVDPNIEEKIIADLSYLPENSTRREQKLSFYIFKAQGSVLSSSLDADSSSFAGKKVNFSYALANNGQSAADIRLEFSWPYQVEGNVADKISLAPSETKKISGALVMPKNSGNYPLEIKSTVLINNRVITQTSDAKTISVVSPRLFSSASFASGLAYAEPGKNLTLRLSWKNDGDFKLKNARMKLTATPAGVVDWTKTARENMFKAATDGLIIDGSARTALASGDPKANDEFSLQLYLLPRFGLSQGENTRLRVTPIMEAAIDQAGAQTFESEGAAAELPLSTEVALVAEPRYYTEDGDQLGRGPLPPRVGQSTKYWIFLQIKNTTNKLRDASLATSLPHGVELTGKQSVTIGPQIKYDADTRAITWAYDSLPAGSVSGVYFEVEIIPTSAQIGQNVKLLDEVSVSVTDDFVGKKFSLKQGPVYNILSKDDRGSASGSKVSP